MKKYASLVLTMLFISKVSLAAEPSRGGIAVPAKSVFQVMTVADVTNQKDWCTPATQIGPRVFITAAHCVPALDGAKELRIRSPEGDLRVGFTIVASSPPLTDEDSINSPACKALIDSKADGATLTRDEMKSCWAGNGVMDIALLITERPILSGKMASLSALPSRPGVSLELFGWADSCGVPLDHYRLTRFQIFDYVGSQVVMDGSATNSWSCPGESGGVYFNDSMEATAINTGGTNISHLVVTIFGKTITLPSNFAGGTDLTLPSTRSWLEQRAADHNLEICGLNLSCPMMQRPALAL